MTKTEGAAFHMGTVTTPRFTSLQHFHLFVESPSEKRVEDAPSDLVRDSRVFYIKRLHRQDGVSLPFLGDYPLVHVTTHVTPIVQHNKSGFGFPDWRFRTDWLGFLIAGNNTATPEFPPFLVEELLP